MCGHHCARPPPSVWASISREMAGAAIVVGLTTLDCIAGDGFTVNRLARHAVLACPRLCLRRCRRARQPASHRVPPRLRHSVQLGAFAPSLHACLAEAGQTAVQSAKASPRASFTSPSPSAASARACPCADNDDHRDADDDGAPASTPRRIPSGTVGPACTGLVSTPGRSACSAVEPACTVAVRARRTIVRRSIGSACSGVVTCRRPAVSPADSGPIPAAIQKGWP